MFDSVTRNVSITTISRMRLLAQQSTTSSSSSQMWAAVAGAGRLLQQTMTG
jgi:hypothetical protein